ncbi:MAG: SOS response-associated peptidase, partial [Bacteroidota bacterium]
TSIKKIEEQFGQIRIVNPLPDNYNVAPTQKAYVITNSAPDQIESFHWGLLPFWSKEGKLSGRLINARSEGIAAKPSFRLPIRKRRCLVLADSFYEWKTINGQKIPYRILLPNDDLLVFAGIWEIWGKGQDRIPTFSIITIAPNKEMSEVHNRMPAVLLTEAEQQAWLADQELSEILPLLQTLPDDTLHLYRVSTKVNGVRNSGKALHEKWEAPPTLF